MKRIAQVEQSFMRDDVPPFSSGDTVKVHVKIKEGDKERIQIFQGTVIGRRGGGTGETFTVRKISSGIGVERVFPLHSPNVAKVEKVRGGQVRRAKLYYLRKLTGKSARIKEQIIDKETAALLAKAGQPAVAQTDAPEPKPEPKPEAAEPSPDQAAEAAKAEEAAAETPEPEAEAGTVSGQEADQKKE